jgi:hypothetical protein
MRTESNLASAEVDGCTWHIKIERCGFALGHRDPSVAAHSSDAANYPGLGTETTLCHLPGIAFPRRASWSRVHTCVGRPRLLLPYPEPLLIWRPLGGCGKWHRNFRPRRPSWTRNALLPLPRWRISKFRGGLSRSHHPVGLRADHRIALASTVL